MHTGHAEVLRVRVGEGTAGHQRRHDRHAGALGEGQQLGRGTGLQGATTDVKHGARGAGNQFSRGRNAGRVEVDRRTVARQVQLFDGLGVPPLHGRLGQVLGDVDQDGAGTAGRGDVEGGRDGAGNVVGRFHQEVVLGNALGDTGDVALLEGVGTDGARGDLAGNDHERGRVHVGVTDGGHDVGRPGAGGDHGHTGTAGGEGVALGHVAGTLLVADEYVADARVDQRVVDREDGATGQAEDNFDSFHLQALDEGLRASQLHNFPLLFNTQKGLPLGRPPVYDNA